MVPDDDSDDDFAASLTCIDDRGYDGLTVDRLLEMIADQSTYYAFLVDRETVTDPEHPIVVVDTSPDDDVPERPRGRTFRTISGEMFSMKSTCPSRIWTSTTSPTSTT
ncbi:hypothetical protein B2J88_42265 [Rhodococcus sp. SRB_17]|nr:hypothetical protein [Rhodococcus sp. SRB_17]